MEENNKVFWHEAFFEALQLEFHQYHDALIFDNEYQLSKEALIMDVLVIKKKPGQQIDKNIGRIFKTHNIFEYKSETDSLTQFDYNKVVAYALLYSSFNTIPVSDITVTFAVTAHPRALIKYLRDERGFTVQTFESGIYYIRGDAFPIQVLESKLLPQNENLFLHNLRSNLDADDMTKIFDAYKGIKHVEPKNVYLDRLIQANPIAFEEAMDMSDVALELLLKVSEKRGDWLEKKLDIRAKEKIAKKLLLDDHPVDYVVAITELPYEEVARLA